MPGTILMHSNCAFKGPVKHNGFNGKLRSKHFNGLLFRHTSFVIRNSVFLVRATKSGCDIVHSQNI